VQSLFLKKLGESDVET